MDIVFFYMGEEQKSYVNYFIDSIRLNMPRAKIWQFTDKTSPVVPNINNVMRFPLGIGYSYDKHPEIIFRCLMKSPLDVMINVDADILFNGDVSDILDGDYDIAICKRGNDDGSSRRVKFIHPYVGGFFVTKNKVFWEECYKEVKKLTYENDNPLQYRREDWNFMKGQQIYKNVVESGKFKVKILNGEIFNYTPKNPQDWHQWVKVVHFKGDRKHWMKEFLCQLQPA